MVVTVPGVSCFFSLIKAFVTKWFTIIMQYILHHSTSQPNHPLQPFIVLVGETNSGGFWGLIKLGCRKRLQRKEKRKLRKRARKPRLGWSVCFRQQEMDIDHPRCFRSRLPRNEKRREKARPQRRSQLDSLPVGTRDFDVFSVEYCRVVEFFFFFNVFEIICFLWVGICRDLFFLFFRFVEYEYYTCTPCHFSGFCMAVAPKLVGTLRQSKKPKLTAAGCWAVNNLDVLMAWWAWKICWWRSQDIKSGGRHVHFWDTEHLLTTAWYQSLK